MLLQFFGSLLLLQFLYVDFRLPPVFLTTGVLLNQEDCLPFQPTRNLPFSYWPFRDSLDKLNV